MKMDNHQTPFFMYLMTVLVSNFINFVKAAPTNEFIEVELGNIAVLNCNSNDDNHRFQFWMLNTKDYIGPGSAMNKHKYKYEVLTGTLYIKDVSEDDDGLYTCFCKHLTGLTYNVKSVELIVNRNWEDVYENDSSTNIFRIGILFAVVVILFIILFSMYYLQRRKTAAIIRDMLDEESGDEEKPHTSFQRMVNSTNTINTEGIDGLDNQSLDTELPKQFETHALISNRA